MTWKEPAMKRALILTVATITFLLVLATASAIALWGDHLGPLLKEGYPKDVWPAPGKFATVGGSTDTKTAPQQPIGTTLSPGLKKLFDESGGRAIIAMLKGRIVLEHYAPGFTPKTKFNSYSVAKSLIGALVAKAAADGVIENLSIPIGKYLPAIGDPYFRQIPIVDFLTMQSGVVFEPEPFKRRIGFEHVDIDYTKINLFGPMARLHVGGLPEISAGLRSDRTRRGEFFYQNVNTAILGSLLEKVYDQRLADLLSAEIWRPSGAATALWREYAEYASVSPYCCIYATPRDWVQVAQFLMLNGTPEKPFFKEPMRKRFFDMARQDKPVKTYRYGLQIRHDVLDRPGEKIQGDFSFMMGRGGQVVYMMPEKDLVVVRFGEKHQLLHSTLYEVWRMIEQLEQTAAGAANQP